MHLFRFPLALALASVACWAVTSRELYSLRTARAGCTAATQGEKGKLKSEPEEERVLELIQEARRKAKVRPYVVSPVLTGVARQHSANMMKQRKLDHELDGKDVDRRLDDAGYRWLRCAENISMSRRKGKEAADQVFESWMSSKGHRGNILSAEFTEVGVGIARNEEGEVYFTQVFGSRQKR
jgi:uncharacterized protein YkwD